MRLQYIKVGNHILRGNEFRSRMRKAASGLEHEGLGPDRPVAVLMRNAIAQLEIAEAVRLVGAYAVQINWHAMAGEIAYILQDCGAELLFCHTDLLASIPAELRNRLRIVRVDPADDLIQAYGLHWNAPAEAWPEYESWLSAFPEKQGEYAGRSVESVIYTSGTTGRPKGVKRSATQPEQGHLAEAMRRQVFGVTAGSVVLIPAPLYHSAPNLLAMRAMRAGEALILQPRFDPRQYLADIEEHGVTHAYGVAAIYSRLLALSDAEKDQYDLSSLQFLLHTGGPCAPAVRRRMIDWLGPIVHEYYASTETGPITFCSSEDWLRFPGTVGRPGIAVELEIRGENNELLAPGEIGEVCVRNHAYADFTYINLPGAREELDRNGKIATGDLGYLNEEGYLFLCDRKRDVVISGGVNIYPAEIEAAIQEIPGIADCVVFGIPHEEFGESLAALVQPDGTVDHTENSIREQLRTRIAGYKVPGIVELRSELPRDPAGKIRKRLLRDEYWKEAGRVI